MNAYLHRLFVHPVKSSASLSVSSSFVSRLGLLHDRRFMVCDAQGVLISQRTVPKMASVETTLLQSHVRLFCGNAGISIPLSPEGEVVTVNIHGNSAQGIDCGNDAARWISDALGVHCRLVFQDPNVPRVDKGGDVSFADAYPLLLLSRSTVFQINQWLGGTGCSVTALNFRPNLFIDGNGLPFHEDALVGREFSIGTARFKGASLCSRCSVVDVNPATGIRDR